MINQRLQHRWYASQLIDGSALPSPFPINWNYKYIAGIRNDKQKERKKKTVSTIITKLSKRKMKRRLTTWLPYPSF
jgi:hypothetical protein